MSDSEKASTNLTNILINLLTDFVYEVNMLEDINYTFVEHLIQKFWVMV